MSKLIEQLEKAISGIEGADLTEYSQAISQAIEDKGSEGVLLNVVDVAASLLKSIVEQPQQSQVRSEEFRKPRPIVDKSSTTRFFINIGKNDGMYDDELVNYIVETSGMDKSAVKDIKTLEIFSFVTVSNEVVPQLMSLVGKEVNRRKINIEQSMERDSNGGGRPSRPSSGGRSFGGRPSFGGGRPSFGGRPSSGGRSFGGSASRGGYDSGRSFAPRADGERSYAPRTDSGERSFSRPSGDRPSYNRGGESGGRPSYGRPSEGRSFAPRSDRPYAPRESSERSYEKRDDDRPRRPYNGESPSHDAPAGAAPLKKSYKDGITSPKRGKSKYDKE